MFGIFSKKNWVALTKLAETGTDAKKHAKTDNDESRSSELKKNSCSNEPPAEAKTPQGIMVRNSQGAGKITLHSPASRMKEAIEFNKKKSINIL
jgi:hypothetical protein